jgi:hypothetical protein
LAQPAGARRGRTPVSGGGVGRTRRVALWQWRAGCRQDSPRRPDMAYRRSGPGQDGASLRGGHLAGSQAAGGRPGDCAGRRSASDRLACGRRVRGSRIGNRAGRGQQARRGRAIPAGAVGTPGQHGV